MPKRHEDFPAGSEETAEQRLEQYERAVGKSLKQDGFSGRELGEKIAHVMKPLRPSQEAKPRYLNLPFRIK